jgi:hypothetical protein
MFSPVSRYYSLPDIVTTDASGRTLASKTLRTLPHVSGTVRHTVEHGERLDHLAFRYYRQPRKWWRVLDANPELRSPHALLGKEPVVTDRFAVTFNSPQPPWPALVQRLMQTVGVEEVRLSEEIAQVSEERTIGGRKLTVQVERAEPAILVTYNQLNVSANDLMRLVTDAGFAARPPERLGIVGRQIVIPRDVTG